MTDIDLREEPLLGAHSRTTAAIDGDRVLLLRDPQYGLFREGEWLSENAKRTLQALIGPDWLKYLTLADKLDNGNGDQSSAEQDTLYEGFPIITDMAIDLFNMVSRRDERIAQLEDEVQGYYEAQAGEDL